MNSILSLWNAITVSTALIILVGSAIGIMIGVIEPARAARRVITVLACIVLLLMLPPILVGLWRSLSFGQQLAIVMFVGLIAYLALRGRSSHNGNRDREH